MLKSMLAWLSSKPDLESRLNIRLMLSGVTPEGCRQVQYHLPKRR